MEKTRVDQWKGILMVLAGASLWGLSGNVAEYLFSHAKFNVNWVVSIRMLSAGVLLLLMALASSHKAKVWNIWRSKKDAFSLFVFSIFGMLGCQFTFFSSIEHGNAATAALLQFLGPVFIILYITVRFRKLPSPREFGAVMLALVGTFCLLTNGNVHAVTVPAAAISWGILSGVASAFYTMYPHALISKWGSIVVVGWSMVIGGGALCFIHPPWEVHGQIWSLVSCSLLLFVILFGTLLAFYLYLDSLRYITPTQTSLLGSAEPLSATVFSCVWMNASFGLVQAIGGLFIILTVFLLTIGKKAEKTDQQKDVEIHKVS
ncbi:DMT family transporter [Fictibacillus sp. Mic-4]|uniref:DMT family transporter n=1 Tax=Fictibacillus sp. Mic-4 TaxID=3132826 RepID=UPI003CF07D2C